MCVQVLKRDPKTKCVTLAMATIPAIDSSVFAGPKGISSMSSVFVLLLIGVFHNVFVFC
jgi:hypothetical protein